MTTTSQATAVTTETVVDVPIERAFRVFTEDFDRIKPRDHNLLDVEIEETVFETHVGGNIYDRGVDGSECRWEAERDGVSGDGGWPLYLTRFAEIAAESPGATARR